MIYESGKKEKEPKIMAAEAQPPVRDRTAGRPLKSQASDRVLESELLSGKEAIFFLCLFFGLCYIGIGVV